MEDVSTLVARQYEAFVYPQPCEDLERFIASGGFFRGDPTIYAPVLWPEGRPTRPLRILVAGCGTVQAAYTAYMSRSDEVVGVDLSEASLGHERFLQNRHGLQNLKLYRGNLLDVAELGGDFDVIISSGVLHHMADPGAGLAALRDVLAPEGVMVLMLYGQVGRTGVYMLQEAFRRIGVEADSDGIVKVRSVLAELPQHHHAQPYIRLAKELEQDTALVDTFLHPQDRAYTVPEVFDFLESANLEFHNWVDSAEYWRNGVWDNDSVIAQVVDPLPAKDHWAVVELLRQGAMMHTFTARHKGETPLPTVDFASPEWQRFTPHRLPDLTRISGGQYQRRSYLLPCSPVEEYIIEHIDGKRTIGDILALPRFAQIPPDQLQGAVRAVLEHLWKLGHIMVALPAGDREAPSSDARPRPNGED